MSRELAEGFRHLAEDLGAFVEDLEQLIAAAAAAVGGAVFGLGRVILFVLLVALVALAVLGIWLAVWAEAAPPISSCAWNLGANGFSRTTATVQIDAAGRTLNLYDATGKRLGYGYPTSPGAGDWSVYDPNGKRWGTLRCGPSAVPGAGKSEGR